MDTPEGDRYKQNVLLILFIPILFFQYSCDKGSESYSIPVLIPGVTIGSQVWAPFNLDVGMYRNGDVIPKVTDPTAWATLRTGAWCWYNNDSASYAATYGRLYNWYALNDPRGIAPSGYHLPTDGEWTQLTDYLGGLAIAGGKMKSTTGWTAPNTGATNSSGFSGLPGGYRDGVGSFGNVGNSGYWWSSTENGGADAWGRRLDYGQSAVTSGVPNKVYGFSLRCVRD